MGPMSAASMPQSCALEWQVTGAHMVVLSSLPVNIAGVAEDSEQ